MLSQLFASPPHFPHAQLGKSVFGAHVHCFAGTGEMALPKEHWHKVVNTLLSKNVVHNKKFKKGFAETICGEFSRLFPHV